MQDISSPRTVHSGRSAIAVDEFFASQREVIVNDKLDFGDIDSSCSQVSGHKELVSAISEFDQDLSRSVCSIPPEKKSHERFHAFPDNRSPAEWNL